VTSASTTTGLIAPRLTRPAGFWADIATTTADRHIQADRERLLNVCGAVLEGSSSPLSRTRQNVGVT